MTHTTIWRAAVNAMEVAAYLSKSTTLKEAMNGPDQAHWRKMIRAELKSMRLRGVLRATQLFIGLRAIGHEQASKI